MKLKLGDPVLFKNVPVGHAFVRDGDDIVLEKCLGVIDLEGNNAMTIFRGQSQYLELAQESIVRPIEPDTPSVVDISSKLAKTDKAMSAVDESLGIDRESLRTLEIIAYSLIDIRFMLRDKLVRQEGGRNDVDKNS